MDGRVRNVLTVAAVLAATLNGAGPALAAGPSCNNVLTAHATLTADLACAGDGLVVAAAGVTSTSAAAP